MIFQNPQASPADEDSACIGNFIYNFVHIAMLLVVAILHVTALFLYMVLLFIATHVHVASYCSCIIYMLIDIFTCATVLIMSS